MKELNLNMQHLYMHKSNNYIYSINFIQLGIL